MFTGTNKTTINSTLKTNVAFINYFPRRGAHIHKAETVTVYDNVLILRLIFVQDNETPVFISRKNGSTGSGITLCCYRQPP